MNQLQVLRSCLVASAVFRAQYKKQWFWFDEQSCSLKYYRNQSSYQQCLHAPAG